MGVFPGVCCDWARVPWSMPSMRSEAAAAAEGDGWYELQALVELSIKGTASARAPELLILEVRTCVLGISIPQLQPFSLASALMRLRICLRSVAKSKTVMSTDGRVNEMPDSGQWFECSTLRIAPVVRVGPRGWNPGGLKGRLCW